MCVRSGWCVYFLVRVMWKTKKSLQSLFVLICNKSAECCSLLGYGHDKLKRHRRVIVRGSSLELVLYMMMVMRNGWIKLWMLTFTVLHSGNTVNISGHLSRHHFSGTIDSTCRGVRYKEELLLHFFEVGDEKPCFSRPSPFMRNIFDVSLRL